MLRLSEKPLLFNARFKVYWTGFSAPTIHAQDLNIGVLKGCPWVKAIGPHTDLPETSTATYWYRRHKHGLIQLLREVRKKSGGVMYTIDGDPVYATIATAAEWLTLCPDVPVIPVNVSGIYFLLEILQLNPYMGDWKVVRSWNKDNPANVTPLVVKHPMSPEFDTWARYIQHWVWDDYHGVPNNGVSSVDSVHVGDAVGYTVTLGSHTGNTDVGGTGSGRTN